MKMVTAIVKPFKLDEVREALSAITGVASVHDLHVWAMSTSEPALRSALLALSEGASQAAQ